MRQIDKTLVLASIQEEFTLQNPIHLAIDRVAIPVAQIVIDRNTNLMIIGFRITCGRLIDGFL